MKNLQHLILLFHCLNVGKAIAFGMSGPRDHVFFSDEQGQNCTLVEPVDSSWGWVCEGHHEFPLLTEPIGHTSQQDPKPRRDAVTLPGPDAEPAVARSIGTFTVDAAIGTLQAGVATASTYFIGQVDYHRYRGLFYAESANGDEKEQCVKNYVSVFSSGSDYLFYYCLTKTSNGDCGVYLSQSEELNGLRKAIIFYKGKRDRAACVRFTGEKNTKITGKVAVLKNPNPNINACAIQCDEYKDLGSVS